MTYIKEMKNSECNDAVIRIFNKINIDNIIKFIDEIPCISNTRKNFYKKIITIRYNILKNTYNKLNEKKNL